MAHSRRKFDELFKANALLVQREIAWRDGRRVARLLKAAKLKVSSACVEDINWRASRSLDRSLVAGKLRQTNSFGVRSIRIG